MTDRTEHTGTPPILEVRGAGKAYGRTRALIDLDLVMDAGEFVVLLGPNGAGKTTLFQLLTGLFVPDTGRIAVAGLDLQRHTVRALAATGVVFQQPALDLDLTVWGNLMFHARLHGCGRHTRARVQEALERMGLGELSRTRARALSGGNRRKVELARSLVHRPRLLLMDEATVGLDPPSRRQLLEHVRRLCHQDGVAALWATHLVDEAEDADRIVILHKGRKVAEGRPRELLTEGQASLTDTLTALSGEDVQAVGT